MLPAIYQDHKLRKKLLAGYDRKKCHQAGLHHKKRRIRKKKIKLFIKQYGGYPWPFVAFPGPWLQEFCNYKSWRSEEGYECIARRNMTCGNWCGYVLVDDDHPLQGKDYMDEMPELEWIIRKRITENNPYPKASKNAWAAFRSAFAGGSDNECRLALEVHGGLTYTDKIKNKWAYGFDCAHYLDAIPAIKSFDFGNTTTYKDLKFVKEQCGYLAKQLKQIENVLVKARTAVVDGTFKPRILSAVN